MIQWRTTTTYQPRLLLIDTLEHDTLLRATIFPFFKKNSFLFSSFLFPPSLGEFWITLIADENAFRSVPSDDVDPDFYRIDLACQGVYLAKLNMSMFPPFPNPSVVGARTPSTSTCSLISFVTQTGETALPLEISSPNPHSHETERQAMGMGCQAFFTPTGRQMPAADHPPRVTNPPETAASVLPLTQPRLRLRSRRRVASLMLQFDEIPYTAYTLHLHGGASSH